MVVYPACGAAERARKKKGSAYNLFPILQVTLEKEIEVNRCEMGNSFFSKTKRLENTRTSK